MLTSARWCQVRISTQAYAGSRFDLVPPHLGGMLVETCTNTLSQHSRCVRFVEDRQLRGIAVYSRVVVTRRKQYGDLRALAPDLLGNIKTVASWQHDVGEDEVDIDTFEYRLFVSSVSTNLLSRISRVLAVINPILVTTAATVKISGIQVLVPRTLVQWYEQTEVITVRISNGK